MSDTFPEVDSSGARLRESHSTVSDLAAELRPDTRGRPSMSLGDNRTCCGQETGLATKYSKQPPQGFRVLDQQYVSLHHQHLTDSLCRHSLKTIIIKTRTQIKHKDIRLVRRTWRHDLWNLG